MRIVISMDTETVGNEMKILERVVIPDQQFNSLSRGNQLIIIETIKNDLEKIVNKNNLIISRQAGLN